MRPIQSMSALALVIVCFSGCGFGARETPAERLLARSIAFHDPDAVWGRYSMQVTWIGTDTTGNERTNVRFTLNPDGERFTLRGRYRGSVLEYETVGSSWTATVDGTAELQPDVLERMRLDREDGLFWRSYYGFLAGLPMKLLDPGTLVDPEPTETVFEGQEVMAVRVRYNPNVGSDTWYFYFDPESARLVGCRFFHDESANDGEYIVMEDLVTSDHLRLPRHRRWYVNADGRYLGADDLQAVQLISVEGNALPRRRRSAGILAIGRWLGLTHLVNGT